MMGNMLMYDTDRTEHHHGRPAMVGNMLMYDAQIEQNTTVDDLQ